jgi:hypothetical protein
VPSGLSPASQARPLALALAARIAERRSASTESITRKAVGVEATEPKRILIAQHRKVREAVASVCQHQRQVHEDAARIVTFLMLRNTKFPRAEGLFRALQPLVNTPS